MSILLSSYAGREDYRAPAVELTFAVSSESQQRVCAEVSVVDDDRVEDVETFHLEISTRTPRIRLSHSTATVRIEDDDVVSVAMTTPELSVEEGEEVRVCVTRSGVIEKTVTVDLSLESRTAQGKHSWFKIYTRSLIAFHPLSLIALQPALTSTMSTSRSSSLPLPWLSETSAPPSPPCRTRWWSSQRSLQ